MNKSKKPDIKKTFVRNTEQTVSKTVLVEPAKNVCKNPAKAISKRQDHVKPTVTFDCPEPNSSLQVARKIQTLEHLKPRKVKSVSDIDKKQQLVFEEKVAKQVNFPYTQPIYKDLIPLCVKMQSQTMIQSREPLPLKDKEPLLSDFCTPKKLPEYYFQVTNQMPLKTTIQCYDGLRLYKTIQNWL